MTSKQYRMQQFKELARQSKKLKEDRERLEKEHSEYLETDIKELYAAMAVALYELGNSHDDIVAVVHEVAHTWQNHVDHYEERGSITMAEYCNQLTGIDFRQEI